MKKVNFKKVELKGLDGSVYEIVDLKKEFSNVLYMQAAGIVAHNLALKIFNSDGEIELSEEEEELVNKISSEKLTGIFADAIKNAIKEEEFEVTEED